MSHPYVKKIVESKSLDKNEKPKNKINIQNKDKNISKEVNKDNKNKNEINNDIKNKDNEIKINNIKVQNNINNNNKDNLSFSSDNDKGNFNQVLFDYKSYIDNKGPIKRRKDIDIDDEEKNEIKYQKDLINKKKKKGWIKKEEIKKGQNKKDIKLQPIINESIKENNNIDNNGISKLYLGKIDEEINQEEIKINNCSILIDNKVNKKEIINIPKNNIEENSKDKENIFNNLNFMNFSDNNINSNLNNFNNIINFSKDNKASQETLDLDFNSNVQSKDKSYNFNNGLVITKKNNNNINQNKKNEIDNNNNINNNKSKYQEYLNYKNLNKSKNKETINNEENKAKNNLNIKGYKQYELDIKTLEDEQNYDEFYKMNPNNNKKSIGNNNNNLNLLNNNPENRRNKREREKMKGHKCELCKKFYDCINEDNSNFICQECSRHRTNAPINITPQSFYDLNL